MLQILTYLLCVYLVVKGIEVLQIGLASNRENRSVLIVIGVITLIICILAAIVFAKAQDDQALSVQQSVSSPPSPY
jgi:uncharacterized membrane protein HdeD (DUF308 family)